MCSMKDKPAGWTFEKAKAAEVDDDYAAAMAIRQEILDKRAEIQELMVRLQWRSLRRRQDLRLISRQITSPAVHV